MRIKSLLLGSAAASMLAVSGAQAADPIVYIEPDRAEYVRICDLYGVGFFYIPGTETCLRISGHARFQLTHMGARGEYNLDPTWDQMVEFAVDVLNQGQGAAEAFADNWVANGGEMYRVGAGRTYESLSRGELNFDARSETEWGTLQGYIRILGVYTSGAGNVPGGWTGGPFTEGAYEVYPDVGPVWGGATPNAVAFGSDNSVTLDHAFIQLGGLRMGKTDLLISRTFGGYGGIWGTGNVRYLNDNEVSYVFAGNGFTAGVALVENHDNSWTPDFQGLAEFQTGGFRLGGAVTYDTVNERYTAQALATMAIPNVGGTLGGRLFYSQGPAWGTVGHNRFAIVSPASGLISDWSAAVYVNGVPVAQDLGFRASAQWFNERLGTDTWQFIAGLEWQPVQNLVITPEVRHTTNVSKTDFAVRFQRNF